MPPFLSEGTREAIVCPETRSAPPAARRSRPGDATSLHLSKLRGASGQVRRRLKRQGIAYTDQLLEAAGARSERWRLAIRTGIDAALLGALVCRADLIRIKGIGAIFADMLELLGIDRGVRLARQNPAELHRALCELNAALRFARRAPTPEEVRQWIMQARTLPQLVEDDA
jgi:predicted flap endonuclease-1-like 5' DNA nuclease